MTGRSTVRPGSAPPRPGRVTTHESPLRSAYGAVSVTFTTSLERERVTRNAPHEPHVFPSRTR